MFIDAYLSLCSAVGVGTATEMGLPRQPIGFTLVTDRHPVTGIYGLARSAASVRFPAAGVTGPIAGLALFTAPAAGGGDFLIAVLPFSSSRGPIGGGRGYAAEPGALVLVIDELAAYSIGAAHVDVPYAPGAQIGSFWDSAAIGPLAMVPGPGAYTPPGGLLPSFLNAQPVTAGSSLLLSRGVLKVQTS